MNTYIVNLYPYGSISHFPDSQTLFGGICWAMRDIYGETILEEILENFHVHKNRFIVSSVYPKGLIKTPIKIWSSPGDVGEILKNDEVDKAAFSKNNKRLKKAEYMTLNLFKELLSGKVKEKELFQSIVLKEGKGRYKIIDDKILALSDEDIDLVRIKADKGRRNYINRVLNSTVEGNLYYYNRVFLEPNSNLYFFIKTKDISFFEPIFRYLSDGAIGSDKTIGINSYCLEISEKFKCQKSINENFLLSKYIPFYDEINWDKSLYKLEFGHYKVESRLEFMGEDIIKDEIGYLVEGSNLIFNEKKEIYGQLPIVKEISGKKIRQNGIGFFL